MKKIFILLAFVITAKDSYGQDFFNKEAIHDIMHRVNTYQLENPWTEEDDYNWIRGTYYTGVMAAYQATEDKRFLEQCIKWGDDYKWEVPPVEGSWASGANVLTSAQTWAECYIALEKEYMIEPVINYLDAESIKTPHSSPDQWYHEDGRRYVDALFTGPPTLAMLYNITGEDKYARYLDNFVWDVHEVLYDKELDLFYRDIRFMQQYDKEITPQYIRPDSIGFQESRWSYVYQTSVNNNKVIWSRGNGWAVAGIARVLKYLPEDYPGRGSYIELFKEMSYALKERQGKDGFWSINLEDREDFPGPETSGTGFFIYAIAWGVNQGILPGDEFLPVITKGWEALYQSVNNEGKVQWGQLVGSGPYKVLKEDSHEYVTGIFLLAASEVYKLDLK